ncbi:3-phosphoserine/phosphohydroxythreonine transaminase [Ornithinicoccus hortensis]|uniref:3-phosphoserine/phosphohydroxythreonine transaminase n=1 Tax=Ornithinicoccus hortensis TaxID=82346 RepID=UPI00314541AE
MSGPDNRRLIPGGSTVRVHNFSAGPAAMPLDVLEQAASEMSDWGSSGMSVMEVSHRSKEFVAAAEEAEALLRELLAVPDDYRVLFLQGGATGQFAGIPLNLSAEGDTVDYVNTGAWSKKAIAEAKKYATVNVVADESASNYSTTPDPAAVRPSQGSAYLHYTPNETIGGVEFGYVPDTGDVPLVADMSSTILSRPIEVSKFGLIYGGAQKNMGPAGLCLVVVRDDLVGRARPQTPSVWDYRAMAEAGSMLNTPPTFGIYLLGLILRWLKGQGGLAAMGERNRAKAEKLYAAIDGSPFYRNPVSPDARSWMNVPFILADDSLDKTFLAQAAEAGLTNLAGHRSVGGMRASIYNAMPMEGVDALIDFMKEFERANG